MKKGEFDQFLTPTRLLPAFRSVSSKRGFLLRGTLKLVSLNFSITLDGTKCTYITCRFESYGDSNN